MGKFEEDFKDAVDVSFRKVDCFNAEKATDPEAIKIAGGYYRDNTPQTQKAGAYLCYIGFKSLVNPVNKVFCLAYQTKPVFARRLNPRLSMPKWFLILKDVKTGNVETLDKNFAMMAFDFDVDKFFQTDYFERCVAFFKKKLGEALKASEAADASDPAVSACLAGIRRGLAELDNPPEFVNGRRTYSSTYEDPNKKYGAFDKDKMERVFRNNYEMDVKRGYELKHRPGDNGERK